MVIKRKELGGRFSMHNDRAGFVFPVDNNSRILIGAFGAKRE